jgi:hypothetical protein
LGFPKERRGYIVGDPPSLTDALSGADAAYLFAVFAALASGGGYVRAQACFTIRSGDSGAISPRRQVQS